MKHKFLALIVLAQMMFLFLCVAAHSQVYSTQFNSGFISGTQCVSVPSSGLAMGSYSVTGSWTGTLTAYGSVGQGSLVSLQSQTANGSYTVSSAGYTLFQVCGNSVASGAAFVQVYASVPASGSFNGGTISSPLLAPAQASSTLCQSAPSYSFASFANYGLCFDSGDFVLLFPITGVNRFAVDGNSARVASTGVIGFASSSLTPGTADTATSRDAAGVTDFGNGTSGNTSGRVKAAGYMSVGTTFTSSGGLNDTGLTGGATAGKFTTATLTSGSTVITMGNSATAPNGWHCSASDITHPSDIIVGTSASATTATLTVASAITAGDVIEFSCMGY